MDISMFDKGGIVMWVLLAYSIVAMVIIIERLLYLQLLPKFSDKDLQQTKLNQKRNSPEMMIAVGVNQAVLAGVKDLTRVASRIGTEQLTQMEIGLRTMAWLGNTAPLLGLFGTITGMIKAFQVIELAGGKVDAQALAGGIWEAMLTTGAGLAVAIPILLMLHVIEGLVDRRAKSMQSVASLLIESLPHREQGQCKDEIHHTFSVSHAV